MCFLGLPSLIEIQSDSISSELLSVPVFLLVFPSQMFDISRLENLLHDPKYPGESIQHKKCECNLNKLYKTWKTTKIYWSILGCTTFGSGDLEGSDVEKLPILNINVIKLHLKMNSTVCHLSFIIVNILLALNTNKKLIDVLHIYRYHLLS